MGRKVVTDLIFHSHYAVLEHLQQLQLMHLTALA